MVINRVFLVLINGAILVT